MNTTTSPRRIAAHYIYSHGKLLRNPILSLSNDGTVTDLSFADNIDSREGVEFYNGILLPSMVNAHCHLELSYLKGMIDEGGGFAGFADGLGRVRNVFSPEEIAASISYADSTMWKQGVGAVADISNGSTTFAIKHRSNIYYRNFLELFGQQAVSAESLAPVASEASRMGLDWSITPHSIYLLTSEAFASAVVGLPGQTAGEHAALSIHFMESAGEEELYRGEGPMMELCAGIDLSPYSSPADRIVKQVPADRDVLLIHNCCVTEEVVDMIEDHFTGKVTWVLCPRSNQFISRIDPPFQLLRRKGVRIAIGTDSLASNHSLEMVEELKMIHGVPLEEILRWATVGGAEALGLSDIATGFEPGSKCGVVLIDGIDFDTMTLTSASRSVRLV